MFDCGNSIPRLHAHTQAARSVHLLLNVNVKPTVYELSIVLHLASYWKRGVLDNNNDFIVIVIVEGVMSRLLQDRSLISFCPVYLNLSIGRLELRR